MRPSDWIKVPDGWRSPLDKSDKESAIKAQSNARGVLSERNGSSDADRNGDNLRVFDRNDSRASFSEVSDANKSMLYVIAIK
jgi:hypothetical protein